jgi:hypothetical protein
MPRAPPKGNPVTDTLRTDTKRTGLRRIQAGSNHWYKLDGAKVDGVTTLIKNGLPKPGLPYWSARTVAEYVADADPEHVESLRALGRDGMVKALKEIPWTRRDTAAAKGTEVHGYAEKLVKGEPVDVPDHLAGYVESCVKFLDEWRVAPVLVEAEVASRQWKYAGTLDLVADLPDSRRALFDYKTSASGIFPTTALQLAAYRHAEFYNADGIELPMSEVGIDVGYAVWVRQDGYDVIPVQCGDEQYKAFLHVAYVARQAEVMRSWIGEPEVWGAAA